MNINQQWRKWAACGCSHGRLADPVALRTFLGFCDRWKPDRRLLLGDYTDQAAFRSGAKGTSDETASIADDLTAGFNFVEALAPTDWINGNHEDRLWKLAGHYNEIISRAATSIIDEIEALAVKIHAQRIDHYDINRSWVELGGYKFLHGFMFNEMAIRDHAEHFGNCVFAHLHKTGKEPGRRADHPVAYCVGTLANIPELTYAKARRATAAWGHGFAFGEYSDTDCAVWLVEEQGGEWHLPL